MPRWTACLLVVGALFAAAPAGAAASGFLGVYGEDDPGSAERAVLVADAMHAAGAQVVRVPFTWSKMEPLPGVLSFQLQDTEVAAAARAGIDVLPFVIDAPAFLALPAPAGYVRRPIDPADLATFATVLVARYGPGGAFWAAHPELPAHPIRAWQIWNEPNLLRDWYPAPDPAAYAALLRPAAAAIHAADPAAEVLAAGLPDSDNGLPFEEYLDGLYAAGAQRSFDAFSLHAYASSAQDTIWLVGYVRGLLDAQGDTRPMDVTEFGWASGGPVKPQTTTEDGQAQNIATVVRSLGAQRAALRLERLIDFSWRDRTVAPGSTDQWPYHTGLLRTDASAKPALAAFRDAATALAAPARTAADQLAAAGDPVAPGVGRRVAIDHRPLVQVLGAHRRALETVRRDGWRIRVRCRAACAVRMRLLVVGHAPAAHVRVVLRRAWTRTLRVRMRKALHRRARLTLEVADVAGAPVRVVRRIRLVTVA